MRRTVCVRTANVNDCDEWHENYIAESHLLRTHRNGALVVKPKMPVICFSHLNLLLLTRPQCREPTLIDSAPAAGQ